MTFRKFVVPILTIAGVALGVGAANAADDTGRDAFMSACASCHGADASGAGDVAKFLTVPVPGLTGLSAANDGAFPMLDVIHIIDGRTGVRGHGSEMPIWGDYFSDKARSTAGVFGAETVARGRILSLAYYLESIQK